MSQKLSQKRFPKWMVVLTSAILAMTIFCLGIFAYYSSSFENKIFPNVFAGNIDLSGLTKQQAKEKLQSHINNFVAGSLKFSIDNQEGEIFIADLNPSVDIDRAIDEAYRVGRSPSIFLNALERASTVFYKTHIAHFVGADDEALKSELERLDQKYSTPEKNAGIEFNDGQILVTPDSDGIRIDETALKTAIANSFKNLSLTNLGNFPLRASSADVSAGQVENLVPQVEKITSQNIILTHQEKSFAISRARIALWLNFEPVNSVLGDSIKIGVNRNLVEKYTQEISQTITVEPINAKLKMEDGKVVIFESSKDGVELDTDRAITLITDKILSRIVQKNTGGINESYQSGQNNNSIELPVSAKKAHVTNNTIASLGIKELLGKNETDFAGSPRNRVHNITLGTDHLNGLLVAPGEEFSTVGSLGEIEASTGYLPELVIKNNITVPEYGGGLCQVSTTLFRAALDSGLKITARREHSFRVGYYERGIGPGLDATIYVPNPDFKFLNDTESWILVQSYVKNNKVAFEIYGTSDGRESKIDGPHIISTTPAPAPTYTKTNNLPAGEVQKIANAVGGARTTAKYSVYRDGELLFEQTFNSSYRAVPARYLVGPDLPPEPPKEEVKGVKDKDTDDANREEPETPPQEPLAPPAQEEPETPTPPTENPSEEVED